MPDWSMEPTEYYLPRGIMVVLLTPTSSSVVCSSRLPSDLAIEFRTIAHGAKDYGGRI